MAQRQLVWRARNPWVESRPTTPPSSAYCRRPISSRPEASRPTDFCVAFTPSRGSTEASTPSGAPATADRGDEGERWRRSGHQRLPLELHPPAPRPPQGRDLHRVVIAVGVGGTGEAEAGSGHAERGREAAGHRIRDGAQRRRGPEQRDVDQRLLLAEVQRGEEGVGGVAQLGDGHDRHHLGRGVQRVMPALPPEPPCPGGKGVRGREPGEIHRTQLAGVGPERRHAVRSGDLGRRWRESEHAAVRRRSVAWPPPLHSARAALVGACASRRAAHRDGEEEHTWPPAPLP